MRAARLARLIQDPRALEPLVGALEGPWVLAIARDPADRRRNCLRLLAAEAELARVPAELRLAGERVRVVREPLPGEPRAQTGAAATVNPAPPPPEADR